MSSSYLCGLKKKLTNKKFAIVVISKSGTTLEPALAFRIFRKLLEKNIGIKQSHKYIVSVTDYEKGTLLELSKKNHYIHFGIPNNIGGRFSTLTSVGLLVFALKGINPLMILHGAKQALLDNSFENKLDQSNAFIYACYRHYLLIHRKKSIENFIVYDPNLEFIAQL
jgi:glucose-6-phosphate isomerase